VSDRKVILNDEMGRTWKEGFLACFNVLPCTFIGGTEVNQEINIRRIGIRIENRTWNLKNMKQEC
jgi:hypothetical protein